MSIEVLRPTAQPPGLKVGPCQQSSNVERWQGKGQGNGKSIDFGGATGAGLYNNQVNFGDQSHHLTTSKSLTPGQLNRDDDLMALVRDLVQQISQLLSQLMQHHQNGHFGPGKSNTSNTSNSALPGNGSGAQAIMLPPAPNDAVTARPAPEAASPANSDTSSPSGNTSKPDSTASVDGGQTVGSGPYALNISNTQDHEIRIGQFDQKENLVSELILAPKGQPGSTGTMQYPSDTTTLIKQADRDGRYRPDASRLETYNGFINTSYIDGRNASIYASDGKGFEIGDRRSIAEEAKKAGLINNINETIPGWYDGSTSEMQKGGEFLEGELGTGDSYIHPDDDRLGAGKNPMRHTDAMTLNVEFGKT